MARTLPLAALGLLLAAGCGARSGVWDHVLLGDAGIGDGGTDGGDGGQGTPDGGPIRPTPVADLTSSIVTSDCSPTDGAAFDIIMTKDPLTCDSVVAGIANVVVYIYTFPFGPMTIRFNPKQPNGAGRFCDPARSPVCVKAVSGVVRLTDWPGNPGPSGSYRLDLENGQSIHGSFSATLCPKQVTCG